MSTDPGSTESQDVSTAQAVAASLDMSKMGLEAEDEGHTTAPSSDVGNSGGYFGGYDPQTVGRSIGGSLAAWANDPLGMAQRSFPDAVVGLAPGGIVNTLSGLFGAETVGSMMATQRDKAELDSAYEHNTPEGNKMAQERGYFSDQLNGYPEESEFGRQDPFMPEGMTTPTMIPQAQGIAPPVSAILGPSAMVKGFQGWDPYSGVYQPRMWGPR